MEGMKEVNAKVQNVEKDDSFYSLFKDGWVNVEYEEAQQLEKQHENINPNKLSDAALGNLFGDRVSGYSKAERKNAVENVERLVKYYKKYSETVDSDLIATEDEKLDRKWDPLRNCQRDLQIYLNYKGKKAVAAGKKLSESDQKLLMTYVGLRSDMTYKNQSVKTKEKPKPVDYVSEGLSNKKIAALSRIDTWVVRNFRNGGALSFPGVYSDRTDIVGKLLSLSPRKRLYVYYLIETKQRKNPTKEGFMQSQVIYTPDVDKFKDRMIATRWKFYKRFSGKYIYWNKLTEAMAIAQNANELLNGAALLLPKENEGEQNERQNNLISREENKNNIISKDELEDSIVIRKDENQNVNLKETLDDLVKLMLLKSAQKNGVSRDALKADQKSIDRLVDKIIDRLQKLKAESGESGKEVTKEYTVKLPSNVHSIGNIVVNSLKSPTIENLFHLKAEDAQSFATGMSEFLSGVTGIASLAGAIFDLLTLKNDSKSMTGTEASSKLLNMFDSGFKATRAGASLASAFGATGKFIEKVTSKASWYATAGVDTAVAALNTVSYAKSARHRVKASKLAAAMAKKKSILKKSDNKERTDEDRFQEGMLALNRKLGSRQKKNVLMSSTTATISSTAVILTTASILTAGIGAIVGAVTFGVGIGISVIESSDIRKMKLALFDSYFDMEDELKKAKDTWKQRHPGEELSNEQEKLMKRQLRYRIAASKGFYSPRHAAKVIAKKYAAYLLENAHGLDREKSDMCVNMIKGLGLKYRYYINDPDKSIPKESDIVKKLCG